MKTNIYMVRHAESPYDEGTERTRGLTPKGKADIEKVTGLLINEKIDKIISSPYARAILSVEGLAMHLNLQVETFEDLREFDFGAEMIEFEELMASIREGFKNPDYFLPGAESNAKCQKRAIAILESILNEHKGKKIAVGTHGLVMTLMMNYFDQDYDFDFLNQLSKPDIYKMEFEDLELKEVTRLWKE
ncbi:2,3-bisphosphoglycerate-dependent phosphoglycerate mutase [Paenibacillus turicensis]|uniref:2,3-bisphosphoglycerate-dependent phosphoglycerate mutase n=1 Tax=Paenibacillus turicensis TaxID=160487 RepID=A0ABS4FT26_9BACL|nr:histidine phosphatase family protein [Paenibacillus turicensis]MBP1905709.1 2,3-bisphosphoglycerate-dependent phosphoglycerate mutase [Paenibacillus turicensis]